MSARVINLAHKHPQGRKGSGFICGTQWLGIPIKGKGKMVRLIYSTAVTPQGSLILKEHKALTKALIPL